MIPSWKKWLAGAGLLVGSLTPAQAAPVITNAPYSGSAAAGTFGSPNVATFGQAFRPSGPELFLNDFTLSLRSAVGSPITFRAFIQQFDETTQSTLGNILFSTGPITNTATGNATGDPFQPITVSVPSLALGAGNTYLAYFSTSLDQPQANPASGQFAYFANTGAKNVGALGELYFANNGSVFNPTTGPANPFQGPLTLPGQLLFTADLSATRVPEIDGASAAAPLCGLLFATLIALDRRQKATA